MKYDIEGEWREATEAERESLRFVAFYCAKHPWTEDCRALRPDCLRVMENRQPVAVRTYSERLWSYPVTDRRRNR